MADDPHRSARNRSSEAASRTPANRHLSTQSLRAERPHRTQEVVGSSPARSAEKILRTSFCVLRVSEVGLKLPRLRICSTFGRCVTRSRYLPSPGAAAQTDERSHAAPRRHLTSTTDVVGAAQPREIVRVPFPAAQTVKPLSSSPAAFLDHLVARLTPDPHAPGGGLVAVEVGRRARVITSMAPNARHRHASRSRSGFGFLARMSTLGTVPDRSQDVLSRRRSRVRVPSLPSKFLQIDIFNFLRAEPAFGAIGRQAGAVSGVLVKCLRRLQAARSHHRAQACARSDLC
jgi:hypothetical protein